MPRSGEGIAIEEIRKDGAEQRVRHLHRCPSITVAFVTGLLRSSCSCSRGIQVIGVFQAHQVEPGRPSGYGMIRSTWTALNLGWRPPFRTPGVMTRTVS
jgi:hypothetical protein